MKEFFLRYRNVTALTGVLLVQFILLEYQVRSRHDVRLLRVWTAGTVSPMQKGLHAVTSETAAIWRNYVWIVDAQRQNENYRKQVSQLKLANQELRRALDRFDRKDEMIAYQQRIESETVAADVIGRSSDPHSRAVFLDKGTSDGVRAGMPVITPEGVVGRVQMAYDGTSLVRLAHDAMAGTGVLLERSQVRGVMRGNGDPRECLVEYIRNEVQVAVGEAIYTSGDDWVYPRGLPVGKVTRVQKDGEFQKIHAFPAAPLDRLDEVLIVFSGVHERIPEHLPPQVPRLLMAPEPEVETSEDIAVRKGAERPDEKTTAPGTLTDADRIRERYRAVAAAQGHVFGEGAPGTPAPNFNLEP